MAPPKRREQSDEGLDDWITTYADMVTLLMAFFVLLMSVSKVDMVLFEDIKAGMAKSIGKREAATPIQDLKSEVEAVVAAMQIDEQTDIGKDEDGLRIDFMSGAFFKSGSATIKEEAKPALDRIAKTLASKRFQSFQIEVQGHTDDVPINTPQFPSNWELSANRATGVVRFFSAPEYEIDQTRFKAVGFAHVAPRAPNTMEDGTALPVNREINRRITVRLYPIRTAPKARKMSQQQ